MSAALSTGVCACVTGCCCANHHAAATLSHRNAPKLLLAELSWTTRDQPLLLCSFVRRPCPPLLQIVQDTMTAEQRAEQRRQAELEAERELEKRKREAELERQRELARQQKKRCINMVRCAGVIVASRRATVDVCCDHTDPRGG